MLLLLWSHLVANYLQIFRFIVFQIISFMITAAACRTDHEYHVVALKIRLTQKVDYWKEKINNLWLLLLCVSNVISIVHKYLFLTEPQKCGHLKKGVVTGLTVFRQARDKPQVNIILSTTHSHHFADPKIHKALLYKKRAIIAVKTHKKFQKRAQWNLQKNQSRKIFNPQARMDLEVDKLVLKAFYSSKNA